jgi:RimJ/RimL family protein N-acetyltransferase
MARNAGVGRLVELHIDSYRVASQRVAIKAGFTMAGTVVSHVSAIGATYEDLRYTRSRQTVTV